MRTLRKTLLAVPSSVEWKVLFPKVPYENSVQKPFVLSSSLEAACVGVGLVGFASGFTQLLGSRQYAKAILVGIAGALPFSGLSSGTIVRVDAECVGDVGYWNDGVFSPFSKRPYCFKATSSKWAPPSIAQLSGVRGVSVNTMTSCEQVLEFRARFYKAQVEAMEGASALPLLKRWEFLFLKSEPLAILLATEMFLAGISNSLFKKFGNKLSIRWWRNFNELSKTYFQKLTHRSISLDFSLSK